MIPPKFSGKLGRSKERRRETRRVSSSSRRERERAGGDRLTSRDVSQDALVEGVRSDVLGGSTNLGGMEEGRDSVDSDVERNQSTCRAREK